MTTGKNVLRLKPIWDNGSLTYEVIYPRGSESDRAEIDDMADAAGYQRSDDVWLPTESGHGVRKFGEALAAAGFKLEYESEPDDAPFNLQRLHLENRTRHRIETLRNFELFHLSGWTPVQAEGRLDGRYFYFRARGTYWRFELGETKATLGRPAGGTRNPGRRKPVLKPDI